jgi:thiaminase/transcriptional activator TenA
MDQATHSSFHDEKGRYYRSRAAIFNTLHPYRDWLLTYAQVEFAGVSAWMRSVIDDEASQLNDAGRQQLQDIFRMSSRYEYLFWQMAWTRETWPV